MQQTITVTEFCTHHCIDASFLRELQEQGLLLLARNEQDEEALDFNNLTTAERLVRLHYDLHINLEGLDVIQHLLHRLESLQTQMASLRNRLQFYGDDRVQ